MPGEAERNGLKRLIGHLRLALSPKDDSLLEDEDRRRRHLVIICDLFSIMAMLAFMLIYPLIGWELLWRPWLLSAACIPLYLLSMLLAHRRRIQAARILFFASLAGSIFISTYFFVGRSPGLHVFLLMAAMLPILLWPLRQLGWIFGTTLACLGLFIAVQYRGAEPAELAQAFPKAWRQVFSIATVLSVYMISAALLVIYQRRADEDARTLADRARRMEELMRRFEALSNTDPLTGLLNRRAMTMRMEEERLRMNRNHAAFSLLIGDLDLFKAVNDSLGHEAGDRVLVEVADALRGSLREVDHAARWGGEEFLVLLPDTPQEGARIVAEKLRQLIEGRRPMWREKSLAITITFGVATYGLAEESLNAALARADAALYEGKRRGRNQVVVA